MKKNMGYLVKKGLHSINTVIKKQRKAKDISDEFPDLSELPKQSNYKKIGKPMYTFSEEDGIIYRRDENYVADFLLEEELFCLRALQNLGLQGEFKIIYEVYDIHGNPSPDRVALYKINPEYEVDILKILNEIERLKGYGLYCCLFDNSRYSHFVKNFQKQDELYYRRALENLKIQEQFYFEYEAYDIHGRRLYNEIALYKYDENNEVSVYKINDEVNRLKTYGIDAKLLYKYTELYFVCNFHREEEIYYRRALQNFNMQGEFKIIDEAYDAHGREIPSAMALYRLDANNNFSIRNIFKEIDRIKSSIAS